MFKKLSLAAVALSIGAAAIAPTAAEAQRYYGNGYNNGGYYDRGYYGPPPAYYYERPYYPRCWTSWRWDPYWGRDVPVRVCR